MVVRAGAWALEGSGSAVLFLQQRPFRGKRESLFYQ